MGYSSNDVLRVIDHPHCLLIIQYIGQIVWFLRHLHLQFHLRLGFPLAHLVRDPQYPPLLQLSLKLLELLRELFLVVVHLDLWLRDGHLCFVGDEGSNPVGDLVVCEPHLDGVRSDVDHDTLVPFF